MTKHEPSPNAVNCGGAQINQTGGTGNTANISQAQMPHEYGELLETLRVQVSTMLQLDEFADEHRQLAHIQKAIESEPVGQVPSARLKEAAQLLKDVVSGAATSALAQLILKNSTRLLALFP